MLMNEMIKAISESYGKQFPQSRCIVKYNPSLWRSIGITCKLANERTENSGGYWENDMFDIRFSIAAPGEQQLPKDINAESKMPEALQLEIWDKSYLLKPTDSFMAFNRRSLSFRKTTGSPEKIVKTLDKYFKMLREQLEADLKADAIHKDHLNIVKSKLAAS